MHVLQPAYGRIYHTIKHVTDSYEQGFDFEGDVSLRFQLCSCRDFIGQNVELRFGVDLQHSTVVMVSKQKPMTDDVKRLNRI